MSRGFTKIGFTTPHEMPCPASVSAASMAAETGLPNAKITTSLPSRTTDPFPFAVADSARNPLGAGGPSALP